MPAHAVDTPIAATEAAHPWAWMVGCWAQQQDDERVTECWLAPDGSSMFGINKTVRGGRTVAYEYLRIEFEPKGTTYFASPMGRTPPTAFRLVSHTDGVAVFENPEHDFPRRITYRRDGDVLHARAEGAMTGKPLALTWSWERRPSSGDRQR